MAAWKSNVAAWKAATLNLLRASVRFDFPCRLCHTSTTLCIKNLLSGDYHCRTEMLLEIADKYKEELFIWSLVVFPETFFVEYIR